MSSKESLVVYYAKTDGLDAFLEMPVTERFIGEERLKKMQKLRQKEDMLRAFGAGLLLEYGLRQQQMTQGAAANKKAVTICYGANGKPVFEGRMQEDFRSYFNLSHSGNYVAAAFAKQEVGVDIEILQHGKRRIAERFFSEKEKEFLKDNWDDSLFTKLWTRKESYIKADGRGMALGLDTFSVLEDCVFPYYLSSYNLSGKAWLSVCLKGEKPDIMPQKVDLKQFIEMEE